MIKLTLATLVLTLAAPLAPAAPQEGRAPRTMYERNMDPACDPVCGIQRHLGKVIEDLRGADIAHLTDAQIARRLELVGILDEYRLAGEFPQNTFADFPSPVFIDAAGTACAVGHLMIESGHGDLARTVAENELLAYVADITTPGVVEWATEHGLRLEECADIQPTYGSCPPLNNLLYGSIGCEVVFHWDPVPGAQGWGQITLQRNGEVVGVVSDTATSISDRDAPTGRQHVYFLSYDCGAMTSGFWFSATIDHIGCQDCLVMPYGSSGYRHLFLPASASLPTGFEQPGFDDSSWALASAPFGSSWPPVAGGTPWPFGETLLVRRTFDLGECAAAPTLELGVSYLSDTQVWLNGTDITGTLGTTTGSYYSRRDVRFSLDPGLLLPTGNVLAVLGTSNANYSAGYLDLEVRGVGGLGRVPCLSEPNSTGQVATLFGAGSTAVMENDLTLVAMGLPENPVGYFLASQDAGHVPMAGGATGTLCMGGVVARFPASSAPSSALGELGLVVDLAQIPSPLGAVAVAAGDTWHFQCWYRDIGGTSNFTNSLRITFD